MAGWNTRFSAFSDVPSRGAAAYGMAGMYTRTPNLPATTIREQDRSDPLFANQDAIMEQVAIIMQSPPKANWGHPGGQHLDFPPQVAVNMSIIDEAIRRLRQPEATPLHQRYTQTQNSNPGSLFSPTFNVTTPKFPQYREAARFAPAVRSGDVMIPWMPPAPRDAVKPTTHRLDGCHTSQSWAHLPFHPQPLTGTCAGSELLTLPPGSSAAHDYSEPPYPKIWPVSDRTFQTDPEIADTAENVEHQESVPAAIQLPAIPGRKKKRPSRKPAITKPAKVAWVKKVRRLSRHLAATHARRPGQHHPTTTTLLPPDTPSHPDGHYEEVQQSIPAPTPQKPPQGSDTPAKLHKEQKNDGMRGEETTQAAPPREKSPCHRPDPHPPRECQEAIRPDHTHKKRVPGVFRPYLYKMLHTYPPTGKALGAMLFGVLFWTLAPTQIGQLGDHPHHLTLTAAPPTAEAAYSPGGYPGLSPQVAPQNSSLGGLQFPQTREIPPHNMKFDGRQVARALPASPDKGGDQERPADPLPPAECQEAVPSIPRHLRGNTGPPPRDHPYQTQHTHASLDPGRPQPETARIV